jgi:hypothetical protein
MPTRSTATRKRSPERPSAPAKKAAAKEKPRCGLCGKRGKLTKTECCGQWVCDDAENYVLFSYAHNSCFRNHSRYTLCAYHYNEGHKGDWHNCKKCRKDIEPEMYVYYGTNDYNFEKLADPPAFEPTRCTGCKRIIKLADDGYSVSSEGTFCIDCRPL